MRDSQCRNSVNLLRVKLNQLEDDIKRIEDALRLLGMEWTKTVPAHWSCKAKRVEDDVRRQQSGK